MRAALSLSLNVLRFASYLCDLIDCSWMDRRPKINGAYNNTTAYVIFSVGSLYFV